jgi:segregation and condensation protein B
MNTADAKRVLETALICSQQPLPLREMRTLFQDALGTDTIKGLLEELQDDWAQRGVELVGVASGWRFQSRPEMREFLDRLHPEKPPRYTRAALETLAIIAYRQPVTRGDMEDIRGVTINSLILKQLEDRGWVEVIGHRETVGRPALYATTRQFLDDLGLASLDQLPPTENPAQAGALHVLEHLDGESAQADLPIGEPDPAAAAAAAAPQDMDGAAQSLLQAAPDDDIEAESVVGNAGAEHAASDLRADTAEGHTAAEDAELPASGAVSSEPPQPTGAPGDEAAAPVTPESSDPIDPRRDAATPPAAAEALPLDGK